MRALASAMFDKMAGDATLVAAIGMWKGQPRIFTKRPVPEGAGKPVILAVNKVSDVNDDFVNAMMRDVTRDIGIYGVSPDQEDLVDDIAERVRFLFHHQPLVVTGFKTVSLVAVGPIDAPVDAASETGRIVTITAKLKES